MQNEPHSLMQGANSGEDKAKSIAWSVPTDMLRQLQQDNARLRTIVAQLLLKNQTLRWQLGGLQAIEMMATSVEANEREA